MKISKINLIKFIITLLLIYIKILYNNIKYIYKLKEDHIKWMVYLYK